MLGLQTSQFDFNSDVAEQACDATGDAMEAAGFEKLHEESHYLHSKATGFDGEEDEDPVGKFRVHFHYNKCDRASLMAQQLQDDEGNYTLRKWNPEKRNVPYGVPTDGDQDGTCGNPLCCYICMCVNCIMNVMFEETVNVARDGNLHSDEYFSSQDDVLSKSAKCIRPLGVFLTCLGFYLLFSPMIKMLAMIPFVGWLLSGIVVVAAIIFSAVVGLTLSILTIAVAWIFFRPLYGILLLAIVGTSVYLLFFYDWGGDKKSGEDTTPATTPTKPVTTPATTPTKPTTGGGGATNLVEAFL